MSIFVPTNNFSRGEVSDSLYDSGDPEIQAAGCKQLRNWFVDTAGAAIRRPGFEFLTQGTAPGPDAHMIHVEFRNWKILLLIFLNPTTNSIDFEYIDLNSISGTPTPLHSEPQEAGIPEDLQLSQIIVHSQFGPSVFFASELFPPLRLFFPLSFVVGEAFAPQMERVVFFEEIFGLTTATNGSNAWVGQDTIYLSQLSPGDAVLFRGEVFEVATVVDDTNFTTTTNYDGLTITDTLAVQRDSESETQLTGVASYTAGFNTLNGSGTQFTTEVSVGDILRFEGGTGLGFPAGPRTVTAVNSNTQLEVDEPFGLDRTGVDVFRLENTPFTLANPKFVSVYQGRLIYAGTNDKPTGIWASKPNEPFILFGAGVNADSPVNVEVIADGLDEMTWMVAQDRLYMGSRNGEYSAGSPDEPMAPSNFGVRKIGATGNFRVPAVAVGTDVFHVNPNQDQLYFTRFDEQLQNFQSDDLSALAPHLLETGVVELVYQNSSETDRTPRFWLRMVDNSIATVALAPRNNVIAWTPVVTGGPHNVTQITASPTQTFLMARDQNESNRYYILRLAPPSFPYAMDYFWTFQPSAGLNPVPEVFWSYTVVVHSMEVGVLGNAEVSETGDLDMDQFEYDPEDLGNVTIGFYFQGIMELLSAQNSDGFKGGLLNRRRRLVRTIVSIRETNQLVVNGLPLLGATGTTIGSDISPQSGKFPVRTLGWGNEDSVTVETANVYPAKVLSIVREIGS